MGGPGSGRKKGSGTSKTKSMPKDTKDLSQGLGGKGARHYYSKSTGEHVYKGKHYTKKQWEKKYQ